MPPKAKATKKRKKTKEELEEERRQAEEAARLAEEERLRAEEEERQRLAELEQQRCELVDTLLQNETACCEVEMEELGSFFGQLKLERSTAAAQRAKDKDWERFLSCANVPHPRDAVAVSDRLRIFAEQQDTQPTATLTKCQDCYTMIDEALAYKWLSFLAQDTTTEARHGKDITSLHDLVGLCIDRLSAHTLQHADMYANERGEVQVSVQQGAFQWCIWVNTSKNPRLKAVEMAGLHMVVEVPKQIALANIAMRVQLRDKDEFFDKCQNEYMAVGPLLVVDLLALPPPAKHIKHWVLRQVTPLANNVNRVPYPIPPAGADPATYRSEEEPPPLGFAYPCPMDLVLFDGEQIKVGWWDEQAQSWNQNGITEVQLDRASGSLSFHTTRLGPLAVIQSRTKLLPYRSWTVRPTGGQGSNTAAVTLVTPGLQEPITFEVGAGWVCLQPVQCLPMLADVCGVKQSPEQLLLWLSAKGLHLLPQDRDAPFAGVTVKQRECEIAMCYDLALLSGAFLIAHSADVIANATQDWRAMLLFFCLMPRESRSKWNQAGAAPDECIARVSEVTDWEGGGRTELQHVQRVFLKEKEEGERRVLAVIRRGSRGVAFCDALDKRAAYPSLIGHETVESVQACQETVWGEVHASLLALLWAAVPEPELPIAVPAAAELQPENSSQEDAFTLGLSTAPSHSELFPPSTLSETADGETNEGGLATMPSVAPPHSKRPGLGPPEMDPELAAKLCATPGGLDLVKATNPVFTETVAQLLLLLRVFSFG